MSNSPPAPIDASNHPDDRFGYSVYAGVLFAGARLTAAVDTVRRAVRSPRASLPAHVTVMGTFCDIASLEDVISIAGSVARTHPPFEVELSGAGLVIYPAWAGFDVVPGPSLVRLHEQLNSGLSPLGTDAYGYSPHGYAPHLTVWQECPDSALKAATAMGRAIDTSHGFTATEVSLVGRRGLAHGGKWETIRSFKLAGAS